MSDHTGAVPWGILPLELRHQIYSEVFSITRPVLRQQHELHEIRQSKAWHDRAIHISLFLVNKAVREDAALALFSKCTVHHSINSLNDQAYITDLKTGRPFLRNVDRTRNFTQHGMLPFLTHVSLDYCTIWLSSPEENHAKLAKDLPRERAIYENIDTEVATVLQALIDRAPNLRTLSLTACLFRGILPHHRPLPMGGKVTQALDALILRLESLIYTAALDVMTREAVTRHLFNGETQWQQEQLTREMWAGTIVRPPRADWDDEVLPEAEANAASGCDSHTATLHPHIVKELQWLDERVVAFNKIEGLLNDRRSKVTLWRLTTKKEGKAAGGASVGSVFQTDILSPIMQSIKQSTEVTRKEGELWEDPNLVYSGSQPLAVWKGVRMGCGNPKIRKHPLNDLKESYTWRKI